MENLENLEISAKTVEQAIQRALDQLDMTREEVEITILREGRPGILGLGAEEAMIRVQPLRHFSEPENNVVTVAKNILEKLLALMDMAGSVETERQATTEEGKEASIVLNIKGEELGILIGRRGQTLASLQHIVRLIVSHQTKSLTPLAIDIEGYRQRRYQALQVLAQRMAAEVKARDTPFTLEPMPAHERRIIHLALANHPDIITQSIGLGEARRVVILPKESNPE